MPDQKEALPTQQFIEVSEVTGSTIVLKGGGLRQIALVAGINFDLKSEEEQGMIASQFQNFLNSLNFTVQVFIHSSKLNIEKYLEGVAARETQEPNELLKQQIIEYREFIRAFVAQNAIMHKQFFVIVPFEAIALPEAGQKLTAGIFGFLKRHGVATPARLPTGQAGLPDQEQSRRAQLAGHIEQLTQRTTQVTDGLNQLGLRAVPLNDQEITELLYNLYNPEAIEKKNLKLPGAEEKPLATSH